MSRIIVTSDPRWASRTFSSLDLVAQVLPHHICILLFPIDLCVYLGSVIVVTVWAVIIHDRVGLMTHPLLNDTDHYSIHYWDYVHDDSEHRTIVDRIGGTHRDPRTHDGEGDYRRPLPWARHSE